MPTSPPSFDDDDGGGDDDGDDDNGDDDDGDDENGDDDDGDYDDDPASPPVPTSPPSSEIKQSPFRVRNFQMYNIFFITMLVLQNCNYTRFFCSNSK